MYLKFLLISFIVHSSCLNLLDVCQSGIRDDGINYVHCARKSLSEIPRFSSNRLFNLAFDELILSDNLIAHIHANAFNGLRIKRLIMTGNQLKSIDENAFRELENYLEELILEFDSTVVDRIPLAIQTNLINIKSLTLIGLNLRILPSNIFNHMKKLESLTLKSCHIQFIETNAFSFIEKHLRYLYLDHNKLNQKIFSEINRLISLEKLSLSNNYIQEFDIKLLNNNLQYLDLSYNYLKKLVINNMNNLQILNLQNNLLASEHIYGSIPKQLKELILDFNAVHSLNRNFITEDNSLEILSLQSNEFLLMNSDLFQHLHKLKKLNLARNNIQMIPKGLFNYTRSLEDLNMDRNPLLPLSINAFSGIEYSLHNLSCQSCSLTSESLIAFSRLKNLERLKLQSNSLTNIYPENLFSSMSKLRVIDLQRNQLTQISSQYPSSLRELALGNNRLTSLPFDNKTFQHLSQLVTLDLSSNPLHCNCDIKSLYYWLLSHFQAELVPYVQWICSKPENLYGKQLGSLLDHQLICEEKKISSFTVWIKDSETALLEWSLTDLLSSLKLIVTENNRLLPFIYLNKTQNYYLLENLKPSTSYSLCLQTSEQYLCRNITTKSQQYISLSSSSSSSSSSVTINIEYVIIGITLGIIIILFILSILILFLIKQRKQYSHSLKSVAIDSYYQTTGSDTTHIATSNNSIEENSIKSFHRHQSMPTFCYCQLPSTCCPDQPAYHLYHEIPHYKPPVII
ncbi:unnamed protein product [Rotaria magnacalcarata]|uniref:LRRCT domain-containing protein n=1 Tax=Rotaria magnacalcarata TaxID=392030 RepID=A0A816Z1C4_9BILA|nr:unnamed protein product [Rotaria magnacalcarata]CAF1967660.1 unnamed protein product [Rotaria magnacalcarata]CAF2178966.1 unnamed protein product [Rotaria magnacalcarata]CAF2230013.1 unnamed protein product [Rotaria magnacalcarata]CAF3740571.1 unnamed protein product [Rotaria magnacalcarata]